MKATVADLVKIMETIAPIRLAEDWDNVGMQVGEKNWPVNKIWISLDPTPEVVLAACQNKVDLLITHHPLIFSTLKAVDFKSPIGKIIRLAAKHKMAIFSAHTNLDNTRDGLNDILAKKVGLERVQVLRPLKTEGLFKLVIYVPALHEKTILDVLIETNMKTPDNYMTSTFNCKGREVLLQERADGSFKGKSVISEAVSEIRIETTVHKKNLSTVIDAIRPLHPFAVSAYDIYSLSRQESVNGAGRIGNLNKKEKLLSFAEHVRKIFGAESIKVSGDPNLIIHRAAVCSGSGSSLINEFMSSGAQVYISGDLRYHDARLVEQSGLALIDIGHFASEFIIVYELERQLQKIFDEKMLDISVKACSIERDPFWSIHG